MKIPKSWTDITISQYRQLISIPDEIEGQSRVIRTISALCSISPREVLKLTPSQLKEITDSLSFISELPSSQLTERFTVNGIEFGILPNLNAITVGELIDLEEYLANWNTSIHKLMAIIYRPIVQSDAFGYTVEEYDTQRSAKAAEWFDQQVSIETLYGATIFFSIGGSNSLVSMKSFSSLMS